MAREMTFRFDDDTTEALQDPVARGNGRHLLADDLDGAQVHVEVRDGAVVGVHAERDGAPVEAFYILVTTPAAGAGSEERPPDGVRCYLCACSGDSCTCRPVECPGGKI